MKLSKSITVRTAEKFIILIFIALFSSCSSQKELVIALSKGIGSEGYLRYCEWLNTADYKVECINLYGLEYKDAVKLLSNCDGLILTGGPDVHPDRYGRLDDTARCSIDPMRDTLEFKLITEALSLKLPIFAICRGEQILNVALGGSLIVDIPEDFPGSITHRCPVPDTCFHTVSVFENSAFYKLTGVMNGLVNTNHHQAVDRIADIFVPVAYSEDGIIEAYEWKEPLNKSYLIAVQWHPERLEKNNPLSYPLLLEFLKKSEEYKKRTESQ